MRIIGFLWETDSGNDEGQNVDFSSVPTMVNSINRLVVGDQLLECLMVCCGQRLELTPPPPRLGRQLGANPAHKPKVPPLIRE
jgi:hypothetical protein